MNEKGKPALFLNIAETKSPKKKKKLTPGMNDLNEATHSYIHIHIYIYYTDVNSYNGLKQ